MINIIIEFGAKISSSNSIFHKSQSMETYNKIPSHLTVYSELPNKNVLDFTLAARYISNPKTSFDFVLPTPVAVRAEEM